MTDVDEVEFLDHLYTCGNYTIIRNCFASQNNKILGERPLPKACGHITNLGLCQEGRESFLNISFVSTLSLYCTNYAESEIIEFSRCTQKLGWMANGRLWYDKNNFSGEKSLEFLTWADSVFRLIKKLYSRDSQGFYVGSNALMKSSNNELQLGPPL